MKTYQSMAVSLKAAHSTESVLLKVKKDIHCNLAKGECQALVLIDPSAAFDTTDHETLLNRLSTWYCIGSAPTFQVQPMCENK